MSLLTVQRTAQGEAAGRPVRTFSSYFFNKSKCVLKLITEKIKELSVQVQK